MKKLFGVLVVLIVLCFSSYAQQNLSVECKLDSTYINGKIQYLINLNISDVSNTSYTLKVFNDDKVKGLKLISQIDNLTERKKQIFLSKKQSCVVHLKGNQTQKTFALSLNFND